MKTFMDENFLLQSETARVLYHDYSAKMPIADFHCHVNPAEIAQDRRFDNITQIWLGGDHYKWRLIRANGTDEDFITGKETSDHEKFVKFAAALPKAVGNPLYNWAHLELRRYFGCDLTLKPETADEIWTLCNKKLVEDSMSVRGIIKQSNVKVIATTDDPADSLEWHGKIAADKSFGTKVAPSFRPDKAINIDKIGFVEYMKTLGDAEGIEIKSLDDLYTALAKSIGRFDAMGCRASDHGLDYIPFRLGREHEAASVFKQVISGESVTFEEQEVYKTNVLLFLGRQYAKHGWVMQLHYGAVRNTNSRMFKRLGPDTGFDAIGDWACGKGIAGLLNALDETSELPKTVLYSLNPNDNAMLATIAGGFPGDGVLCKVQHGSAWWFNDTRPGMEAQLTDLASRGLLGGFIGMLTDSRSFLSYTRHEYFRRILCNLIGGWVENGEYPADMDYLGAMVQDISYNNAMKYFGF